MKRRNQKVCLTILAFALALSGNGCFAPPSLSLPKHPEKLFVYEGLPHPDRERVLFEKKRRGQENEEIHGHRFYSQKTEAKGRDRERLLRLLRPTGGLSAKRVATDCGPFHPDFGIAWSAEEDEFFLMICFSCGELALLENAKEKLFNLPGKKRDWEEALAVFQIKKPKKE